MENSFLKPLLVMLDLRLNLALEKFLFGGITFPNLNSPLSTMYRANQKCPENYDQKIRIFTIDMIHHLKQNFIFRVTNLTYKLSHKLKNN